MRPVAIVVLSSTILFSGFTHSGSTQAGCPTPSRRAITIGTYSALATAALALGIFNIVETVRISDLPSYPPMWSAPINQTQYALYSAYASQCASATFDLFAALMSGLVVPITLNGGPEGIHSERRDSAVNYLPHALASITSLVPPILNGVTAGTLNGFDTTPDENALVQSYQTAAYIQAGLSSLVAITLAIFVSRSCYMCCCSGYQVTVSGGGGGERG